MLEAGRAVAAVRIAPVAVQVAPGTRRATRDVHRSTRHRSAVRQSAKRGEVAGRRGSKKRKHSPARLLYEAAPPYGAGQVFANKSSLPFKHGLTSFAEAKNHV